MIIDYCFNSYHIDILFIKLRIIYFQQKLVRKYWCNNLNVSITVSWNISIWIILRTNNSTQFRESLSESCRERIIMFLVNIDYFFHFLALSVLVTYLYHLAFFGACLAVSGYLEGKQKHSLTCKTIKSRSEASKY